MAVVGPAAALRSERSSSRSTATVAASPLRMASVSSSVLLIRWSLEVGRLSLVFGRGFYCLQSAPAMGPRFALCVREKDRSAPWPEFYARWENDGGKGSGAI